MLYNSINSPENADLQYILNLLENDENAVREVIEQMKIQWNKDKSELARAVEEQNAVVVKCLLHRIKSTFSPLGPDHFINASLTKYEEYVFENSNTPYLGIDWQELLTTVNNKVLEIQKSSIR